MDLEFLIKGLVIGFAIAVPVGPIGVLCIQRTLLKGRFSGLATGMGAATADAIYGTIAAFGLTFISSFLIDQKLWLQIIGALFLVYLGITIFRQTPANKAKTQQQNKNFWLDYLTTVGLTLTNPMTILSFVAVFTGLGLVNTAGDYLTASLLVIGVFLGSAAWWLILSSAVTLLGKKLNQKLLTYANKISGVIILLFAISIIISLTQ